MHTLVLRPKDPNDVNPEELETFATELRLALSEVAPDGLVRVDAGADEHRIGVTFIEIVNVAIEGTEGIASLIAITQAITSTARNWLKKRSVQKMDRRPRSVCIYGPDGKVISRVTLDDGDDEPRVVGHDGKG